MGENIKVAIKLCGRGKKKERHAAGRKIESRQKGKERVWATGNRLWPSYDL